MNRVLATTFAVLVAASCAQGEEVNNGGSDGSVSGDVIVGGDGSGDKDGAVDAPRIPKLEANFPPYGLTWTPTGDLGRAGGLTWTYTGIQRGSLLHIYWIVCDDPSMPCGVSLDGPITMSTEWALDTMNSNLVGGKLVFTNTTAIITDDAGMIPLSGRLTVTIAGPGNTIIPFTGVTMLGVTARDGKYGAEITGTGFIVTALIEVEDMMTSTWTPYLDYYDAAHTVPPEAGNAYVSFGGSFYDE